MKDQNAAFEREALPWIDDVYRFALSLTRDESDADDVVQDTFLRAYRSWHTYLPGSDCRRWLFTICRNVFLRSRERARPTVELDATDVDAAAAGSVYATAAREGFEDIFSRLDLVPAISDALNKVPEPLRADYCGRGRSIVRVGGRDARRADWYGPIPAVQRSTPDAGAIAHVRHRCGVRPARGVRRAATKCLIPSPRSSQQSAWKWCCISGTISTIN